MKLIDLKTENKINPLTIDAEAPVFGWNMEAEEQNVRQEAYRIQVWVGNSGLAGKKMGNKDRIVWDSGPVRDTCMVNIPYRGEKLLSSTTYYWQSEVTCSYTGEKQAPVTEVVKSDVTFFETGYFDRSDWKGVFIGETKDHEYHLYRKTFLCENKIRKAKLYICGLGHFECYINGSPVSDHVLEPGWSDYDKTCFYTSYDVTGLVAVGDNAMVVKLGDGMFHVPGGRYVYYERSYGKSKLLAQLVVDYEDGTHRQVVTDETWKMGPGPVKFCCIYGGEDYDARLWKKEILLPDYVEDSSWQQAVPVEEPKGKLRAMPIPPLKVMEKYQPVSVRMTREGVWLYDLGINFSGWARIKVRTNGNMAGHRIIMKTGEILNQDGSPNQKTTGEGYAWTYILDDKEEQEFAPDFTYTGFRYVEVTGAVPGENMPFEGRKSGVSCEKDLPVIEAMTGEFIYPDIERTGEFWCSNELFNNIHKIIVQAILSNTKSYFTDCPHREKLGWLEQTHLIGPSIMYNFDVHSLIDKIEGDMRDAQRDNGLVSDICPEYVTGFSKWHEGFVDSPEWGSACILSPWYAYQRYGDKALLSRYYGVMKRYLDYLGSRTHHEVLHHGLGDWLDIGPCPPNSQNTPVPVVATCIYYYDLRVMKEIACLLGLEQDAAEYGQRMERVFQEYNLQFLDNQTGRYGTGSQAAQAMSLIAGLVPAEFEEKAAAQLRKDVEKRKFAITAGDVGHPFLIAAMMKYGMSDLLNEMTNITETPGYGYQVANGATTLTEDWDGPDPERPHGSQNHLMLGSIEEWFYGALGGVELVRSGLPFGEVRITPHVEKGVEHVKMWVKHPYGRIAVEWKCIDAEVHVTLQIPPGVTAHFAFPDSKEERVLGSGKYKFKIEKQ